MKGAGNSNRVLNYKSIDENPFEEHSYYSLKQVDLNGTWQYSDIVTVISNEELSCSIFPNPSQGSKIFLTIKGRKGTEITILLFDMRGNKHFSSHISLDDTENLIPVNPAQKLVPGIYTMVINSDRKPISND